MELVSRCGNDCLNCLAYVENFNKYGAEKVGSYWAKYMGYTGDPNEIICDGCLNSGRQSNPDCEIRSCANEKNKKNCAYCDDSICETLQIYMDALEGITKSQEIISEEDYNLFFAPFQNRAVLEKTKEKLK